MTVQIANGREHPRVEQISFGDNIFYLVFAPPADQEAVVIDPADAASAASAARAAGARVSAILITHADLDHTAGAPELARLTGAVVYGPQRLNLSVPVREVCEGFITPFGPTCIRVIETPGHRLYHVAYWIPGEPGLLFTGDCLFAGGCGRLNGLPPELMFGSLRRLAALPDDTLIFGGHDYLDENLAFARTVEPDNPLIAKRMEETRRVRAAGRLPFPSTLCLEKQTNPFLRAGTVEEFARLRRLKDQFG